MAKITRRRVKKEEKESPKMDTKAMYERVAEIKSIIKGLDDESKIIQAELLALDVVAEKIKTSYGTLSLRSRENWKITDIEAVIDYMGQADYNQYSTISKTGIVKAVGNQGFSDIQEDGGAELTSVSSYYQLGK